MSAGRKLVFVGDVHLDRDDAAMADFLSFLDRVARDSARIVLIGDLFNLWVARPELELAHHRQVIEKLRELRRGGVSVGYLEGNRDYRIGARHSGGAFDDAGSDGIVEQCGQHRLFAVHGDLVNPADRQYRLWRRVSRTPLLWGLLGLVPRGRRLRLVEGLESRMRHSNQEFKHEFPEQQVRSFAAPHLAAGADAVVLGHFHMEKDLECEPAGRVLVLPDWKSSRRHLEVQPAGAIRFVDSVY